MKGIGRDETAKNLILQSPALQSTFQLIALGFLGGFFVRPQIYYSGSLSTQTQHVFVKKARANPLCTASSAPS